MFKRMYLEITNVCNLRCAFCPGTQRLRRFMTPEEFRQLATRLRPYGTYLMLHVMGEPLLHPRLAELLAIAGALGIEVTTVKYHVSNMLQKTNLENKLQLAIAASEAKLVVELNEE